MFMRSRVSVYTMRDYERAYYIVTFEGVFPLGYGLAYPQVRCVVDDFGDLVPIQERIA